MKNEWRTDIMERQMANERRNGAGYAFSILKVAPVFLIGIISIIQSEPLSLSDAVKTGLQNNFDIRIARNDAQAADNNRKLKTGYLLPAVTATGGVSYSDVEMETAVPGQGGTSDSYSAGAALSWTLFDGFRMFHAYSLVEESAQLGEEGSRLQIESAVVKIITAYYNLVSARSLRTNAAEQLAVSRAQLERTRARAEYGQASGRLLLAQQVTVNADSAAYAARQLDALTALHNLNVALGRKPDIPVTADETIEALAPEHDAAWWFDKAKGHNAGLQLADIQRNVAASNLGIARAAFWPMLTASGSYTQSWSDNNSTVLAAGLNVSWPLFAGFSRITNTQNAKLDVQNADLSYERTMQELEAFIYQQWARFTDAYGQVGFAREAVELARQSLEVSEEQYRLGQISDVQFREAQLALLNAQVRAESAVFQNRVLAVQLEQMAGVLKIGE